MTHRMSRLAVLTALSALLAIPSAASAHGGECEETLHDDVEPAAGPAGFLVHEAEAGCPVVDLVLDRLP